MRKSHRRLSGTAITGCVRDITSANKAPGGYGFGERPKKIDDPDRLSGTVDGVYHFASEDHPIEGIASGLLIHYQGNFLTVSSFCRQILYAGIGSYSRLERIYANGWKHWEWVNPPMILGTEYRTTERYLGKPVYVKVVDCGNCPESGHKDIRFDTSGVALPIRCYGNWTYDGRSTIPFETTGSDRMVVGIIGSFIRITTGGRNFSEHTCTVTVYYTKTTD